VSLSRKLSNLSVATGIPELVADWLEYGWPWEPLSLWLMHGVGTAMYRTVPSRQVQGSGRWKWELVSDGLDLGIPSVPSIWNSARKPPTPVPPLTSCSTYWVLDLLTLSSFQGVCVCVCVCVCECVVCVCVLFPSGAQAPVVWNQTFCSWSLAPLEGFLAIVLSSSLA
jgi:hypothetical protein